METTMFEIKKTILDWINSRLGIAAKTVSELATVI